MKQTEIKREYAITLSMFEQAFIAFQRRYVYPRNLGITALLLVVAGIYVYSALQDPSNTIAYLLVASCGAAICIMWFNTRKIRRNLMKSVAELADDRYELTIRQDGLLLKTILPAPVLEAEAETDAEPVQSSPTEDETDTNGFMPLFDEAPSEEIPPSEFLYEQKLHIQEKKEFFMLYLEKGMFYVIPKNAYSQTELTEIKTLFKDKLGKRFQSAEISGEG